MGQKAKWTAAVLTGMIVAAHGEELKMMTYTARRCVGSGVDGVDFAHADVGRLGQVRPESSDHRPEVVFRVLHDSTSLYVRFDVKDQYVRSVQTAYQSPVCTDSCVEFFVQPKADKGYFNFEVNAGGTLLLYYVEDPTRTEKGLAKFTPVSEAWGKRVAIRSSLPGEVTPEVVRPMTWCVRFEVPFALFEAFVGEVEKSNTVWRANFYKCGDKTSHPHWLSWSPVSALNFHLPLCFGALALE